MVLGKSECVFTAYEKGAHVQFSFQGFQVPNPHLLQTQASAAPGPASIFKLSCYN